MAEPDPGREGGDPVARATAPEGRGKRRVLTGVVTRDKMEQDSSRRDPPGWSSTPGTASTSSAARSVTRHDEGERVADRRHRRDPWRPARCRRTRTGGWCGSWTKAPRMTAAEAPTKTPAKA